MRLRDAYAEEELPTRPDLPRTAARRCQHCGRVYGDHPKPEWFCPGVRPKRRYTPEDHADADRTR